MEKIKIGDKLTLEQYINDDGTIKTQTAIVIDMDDESVWAELESNKSVMIVYKKIITNISNILFVPACGYYWDSHYRLTH